MPEKNKKESVSSEEYESDNSSSDEPIMDGFSYHENFITSKQEKKLLDIINKQEWNTKMSRRVQHYGYAYKYNHISNDKNTDVQEVPSWLSDIYETAVAQNLVPKISKDKMQIIINEYMPGQGIGYHIDDPKIFGKTIVALTLGSGCELSFTNKINTINKYVDQKSLYVMKNDARYVWQHGIIKRKSDVVNGKKILRGVRISVTFRKML